MPNTNIRTEPHDGAHKYVRMLYEDGRKPRLVVLVPVDYVGSVEVLVDRLGQDEQEKKFWGSLTYVPETAGTRPGGKT